MKKIVLILLTFGISAAFADNISESSMDSIDDVEGNAPKGVTVSSAGIAFEEQQNAAQSYIFFSQTLANDLYYEGRLYGRYNYLSQNPLVDVPVSNIKNPPGFSFSGFLGYNFHPTDKLDITPYVRFNYLNNMILVYEDSDGNFMHSNGYAEMLGVKFAFKVTKDFTPVFDVKAGVQQLKITGQMDSSYSVQTAQVNQFISAAIIGFNYKVTPNIALMPYMEYITQSNSPDGTASAPYNDGGFNLSSLTATVQMIGLRLGVFW